MIVGELTHDHEIVRNVKYESLWDNLGMSDIKRNIVCCFCIFYALQSCQGKSDILLVLFFSPLVDPS